MQRTLYRSRHDRMLAGVAGGIAEYLDWDSALVRIGIVLLALIGNAAVILVYVVMAFVVPEEPAAAAEVPTAADDMGPGEMPEPGEFGTPAVPDPAEGRPAPPSRTPEPEPRAARSDSDAPSTRGAAVVGAALVIVGLAVLAQRLLSVDVGQLWPVILIVIGVWIMFGRGR